MTNFFKELKRRNVIKAALAYVVSAWVILQVLAIVLPSFKAPGWVLRTFLIVAIIGFPIWTIFAWVYEVTPEGVKKTSNIPEENSMTEITNKRLNILILIGLIALISVTILKPSSSIDEMQNKVQTAGFIDDQDLSIAVLPFDDMSSEGDTQWFCDGVTEDILTHLAKIGDLRVISRTSVMQYKNSGKTVPEIAKELGVTHILEGSVRKQDNNVLVTAQLIKANDEHIWADNYNGKLDNVFKIQSDVAKQIVKELEINLAPAEAKAITEKKTDNVEAYELFQKARAVRDGSKSSLEKSNKMLKEAISLDPGYADAYAQIGLNLLQARSEGWVDYDSGLLEAKQYIDKSLLVKPKNLLSYLALMAYYAKNDDWEAVRKYAVKAFQISPNNYLSHLYYADYFLNKPVFEPENYLREVEIAQELDPFASVTNSNKVMALLYNKKLEEAKEHYKKMKFSIDSSTVEWLDLLIKVYDEKDWTVLLKEDFEKLKEEPDNSWNNYNLGKDYQNIMGDNKKALRYFRKAYELSSVKGYYFSLRYFYSLLYNGEFTEAQKLLNDPGFMKVFTGDRDEFIYLDFYYYKKDFPKALEHLEKHRENNHYYLNKAAIAAYQGENEIAQEGLSKHLKSYHQKALVFSIMKTEYAKDSMYFYMNKMQNPFRIMHFNSYPELDKYRNEPRFREFLRKNYLPVNSDQNFEETI